MKKTHSKNKVSFKGLASMIQYKRTYYELTKTLC